MNLDNFFELAWLVLFLIIVVVRKIHEHKASKRTKLRGTPPFELFMMVLWGLSVSLAPLLYLFTSLLNFAHYPFELPIGIRISGIFFFILAIWLLHRSHLELGQIWTASVEPEAAEQLVTKGVFKHVRNPMYAAHISWGIAQTHLLPNYMAGLSPLILMTMLLTLRIPREERALLAQFGDEYLDYQESTGCLIPKFWRRER